MWHLIAHFDGKIYDLGACISYEHCHNYMWLSRQYFKIGKFSETTDVPLNCFSQMQFIKDYKTKHFMNAQLETPDVAARFYD